jgi:sulfite exporter TauE/SafE
MCGPLVILAGARYPRRGLGAAPLHLLYHAGRIFVYALLGLLFGTVSGALGSLTETYRLPGLLSILIGLAVIVAGLSYLGWLPFWRRSIHSGGWWQRAMKRVMKAPGTSGVFLLGMLNGLLPCGLVYEALLIAISSRSPLLASGGMLIFGAATMPSLVIFGVGAQMLSERVRHTLVWAGGLFVVLVGVYLVVRGAAGLGLFPELLLGPLNQC